MALDPFDCAFVYARGPVELRARQISVPENSSLYVRLGSFVRRTMRRTVFRRKKLNSASVFLYVESANQLNSLLPLVKELKALGYSTCLVGPNHRKIDLEHCADLTILGPSLVESLRGMLRGFIALPALIPELRKIPGGQVVLDQLLEPYRLAPMFEQVLTEVTPKLVVVANDHITSCRVLTRLAQLKQIQTAYIQHAQISSLFPPLIFDYALLDGNHAFQVYSEIAQRTGTPVPEIFLGGEKKTPRIHQHTVKTGCIGIGVNPIDDAEAVSVLAERLLKSGVKKIITRLHPAMRGSQEMSFRAHLTNLAEVHIATEVPTAKFLSSISCLIAGESSVHVDALLNHIPSFYAQLCQPQSKRDFDDYYGFLSLGLVHHLPEELNLLASPNVHEAFPLNIIALKKISATFGTPWDGLEFELAAQTLASAALSTNRSNKFNLDTLYPNQTSLNNGRTVFSPISTEIEKKEKL